MAVHERLKDIRLKSSMTQAEFGTAVGVSTNTQVRYEKGHRHPDTEYLRSVANKFSVDFNWLLDGDSQSQVSKMTDAEILSQAEQIRAFFSRAFGMKPDDLDYLLQWLKFRGSGARLNSQEQTILNSYRAADRDGKRALEAVSDAIRKGDLTDGAVPADAWGAAEFVEALQSALSESKK